jgi:hypothetical protein
MQMSTRNRALIVLGAIVVLVLAFALLSGSDDDESPGAPTTVVTGTGPTGGATAQDDPQTTTGSAVATTPTAAVPRIEVVGGEPVGGIEKLEFTSGERVRFTVTSDVADHVHVHGYDLMRDVGPAQPARFSFDATLEGRFEVELEERGVQIARLEVAP